jgi:hypothetical protein
MVRRVKSFPTYVIDHEADAHVILCTPSAHHVVTRRVHDVVVGLANAADDAEGTLWQTVSKLNGALKTVTNTVKMEGVLKNATS